MLQHDLGVKHNWFLLQTGKLVGLSPDYEQHLSSFSYREPVVRTIDGKRTQAMSSIDFGNYSFKLMALSRRVMVFFSLENEVFLPSNHLRLYLTSLVSECKIHFKSLF